MVERPHPLAAGRRLPFVILSTPFMALFAVLIFSPPHTGGAQTAVWLLVTLELYFFFSTLGGGPYEALLPELARRAASGSRSSA